MGICPQGRQEIEAQLQLAQVALFSVSRCRVGACNIFRFAHFLDEQEAGINVLAGELGALLRLAH